MVEIPLEYMNKLANQMFFVSALLGGFSFSTIMMLIERNTTDRLMISMFRLATKYLSRNIRHFLRILS